MVRRFSGEWFIESLIPLFFPFLPFHHALEIRGHLLVSDLGNRIGDISHWVEKFFLFWTVSYIQEGSLMLLLSDISGETSWEEVLLKGNLVTILPKLKFIRTNLSEESSLFSGWTVLLEGLISSSSQSVAELHLSLSSQACRSLPRTDHAPLREFKHYRI